MVFCTYINHREQAALSGGEAKVEVRRPCAIVGPWQELKYAS